MSQDNGENKKKCSNLELKIISCIGSWETNEHKRSIRQRALIKVRQE